MCFVFKESQYSKKVNGIPAKDVWQDEFNRSG